jgi:hypothetical protein
MKCLERCNKVVIVIMRVIQRVGSCNWDQLDEIDKKCTVLEDKLGFPPKKRFRSLTGGYDQNVVVVEREWKSLAEMEKVVTKAYLTPELVKLYNNSEDIIDWQKMELYVPYPTVPE